MKRVVMFFYLIGLVIVSQSFWFNYFGNITKDNNELNEYFFSSVISPYQFDDGSGENWGGGNNCSCKSATSATHYLNTDLINRNQTAVEYKDGRYVVDYYIDSSLTSNVIQDNFVKNLLHAAEMWSKPGFVLLNRVDNPELANLVIMTDAAANRDLGSKFASFSSRHANYTYGMTNYIFLNIPRIEELYSGINSYQYETVKTRIVAHEFGHSLGIDEMGSLEPNSMMGNDNNFVTSLSDCDKEALKEAHSVKFGIPNWLIREKRIQYK